MPLNRLTAVIALEFYALVLAVLQFFAGVRTDEAKYLLNIPYPHPPLVRWLLSLLDWFDLQDAVIRLLLASLLVQAVWLVWDMGRALKLPARLALCALWLVSAAFVLQAGTVMMAVVTALQALAFLWLLSRPPERLPGAVTVAFLWLVTVFSALQGVLLAPLAVAVLRLKGEPWGRVLWYVGAPLVLVVLYALGNPLIMASVGLQAGKDAADTLLTRAEGLGWILVVAGSGVGTVIGIVGLLLKRHWWILTSFVLIGLYVFVGRYDYYAILFLPFFITGAKHVYRRMPLVAVPAAVGVIVCSFLLVPPRFPPLDGESPIDIVLSQFQDGDFRGTALVVGSHGHEWQYYSGWGMEFLPYAEALVPRAQAIICTDACVEPDPAEWSLTEYGATKVWFRYQTP